MRASSFFVSFLVGISFFLVLVSPVASERIRVDDVQTNQIQGKLLPSNSEPSPRPQDKTYSTNSRRLGSSRRLQGNYAFDPTSAEAGFAACLALFILLALLLCCCCCGGGRGCSLWDLVACVCLYELCCDDGVGAGDSFMMV